MLTAKPAILAMGAVAQQQVANAANISVGCNATLATREGDLKSAITAANAASGTSTISLAPNCVYTLTTPQSGTNGLAPITKTLIIDGNSATITRDNSASDFRILNVTSTGNLTLNHVTISSGVATNDTGGGGIWNNFGGTLSVNSSTITGNTAKATGAGSISAKGGGILSGGDTTVTDSDVSGNQVVVTAGEGTASVVASGGGMSAKGGTLTVSHTTLSRNSATANAPTLDQVIATGGGIAAKGGTPQGNGNVALNVIGSTINGNTATANGSANPSPAHLAEGGGIDGSNADGGTSPSVTVKVVNSTVTGNSAVDNTNAAVGGGLNSNNAGGPASLAIVNSTVANNVADHGAIASNTTGQSSPVTTTNTIVASNTGGNCRDTIIDGGHNISFPATDSSCANTFAQGDPLLGVLGNNGGLTKTMALGLGSAAIDTADRTVCLAAPLAGAGGVDQRAFTRTEITGDTSCDIGAFEVQPVAAAAAVPGLPRSGVTTSAVPATPGLPPWAPLVPAAVGAAALVGVTGQRRRSAGEKPQD
jgi:hypothetical protein